MDFFRYLFVSSKGSGWSKRCSAFASFPNSSHVFGTGFKNPNFDFRLEIFGEGDGNIFVSFL